MLSRMSAVRVLLVFIAAAGALAEAPVGGAQKAQSLLQTWNRALNTNTATPIAKVVELLKSMTATLQKEMDEDQKLYEKLKCWCEKNDWDKTNAIEDSKEKIEKLEADILSLTAKKEELTAVIKEVIAKTKANKESLAQAQAIRDKQLQEFHGSELRGIENIEALKAAIVVLGKHHDEGVFSQFSAVSLLSVRRKDEPWADSHARMVATRPLDEIITKNDYLLNFPDARVSSDKFLQTEGGSLAPEEPSAPHPAGWTAEDAAVVRKALNAGSSWIQTHHEDKYYPSYASQSGEIYGILKQLKDEMEAELSEAQKLEAKRAEDFSVLRAAKVAEIEAGERMEEQKEDELAITANALAEAKEDLGQEKAILKENEEFLKNMKETCGKADKAWEERKAARQAEIQAVAETIAILTADEAKDAAAGTYSLFQQFSKRMETNALSKEAQKNRRSAAAASLRKAALKTKNPQLAMLATQVELDAFTKVKAAIDEMIVMLRKQQEDEVKKNDWCKAEFKENEMTTLKTEDRKADIEAKIAELESKIKSLEDAIAQGKKDIDQAQVDLQSASLTRKEENIEYQKTVADQTIVIDVLKKALNRMLTYYDSESLLQRKQDPAPGSVAPVAQMTYSKSKGAEGVIQMLGKLIGEAKELMAESKKAENDAQAGYEKVIADTNAEIVALEKQIVTNTKAKAKATKEKQQAEEDLVATVLELEGLAKYKQDLHLECDFLLYNFVARQEGRGMEIEALQQAKQILNGANLEF